MRCALLLAASLVACGTSPESSTVYLSIGADALPTVRDLAARDGAQLHVLETDGEVAVVELPEAELEALAQQMHEQHHRCGGFIVHDSLDEARGALHVQQPARGPVYSLDRAAIVNAVLPKLEKNRIRDHIGELSDMPNRYYKSTSGAEASTKLAALWRSFSKRPDVTVELFDNGYPQKSVILTIPGSTHPDEVVVIGGHLDSISFGGAGGKAPGADDDASGIATLTEVARVLLAADYRPARTIKFMAYAAEEIGLRGSQGIVRDFQKRKVNVVGALQLDMTNYQGSDRDIWLMKDFTSAAQNNFLIQLIDTYVGATYGLDACGYACSDHASWYRAGVPASMPFESRMMQRNRQIHTREDTLETSGGNADHAVKFARLATSYAIELGKGELGGAKLAATDDGGSGWGFGRLALVAGAGLAGFALLRRRR
ncbi:MAG TPA: M20/M25/M40 family metallo-hydrolase [Kofleriaceae bacterium]|nr:M20/M25/M40 family metallo-hydrolase [Kofleriaceae bacterium]